MIRALANRLGITAILRRLGDGCERSGGRLRPLRRRTAHPLVILPYHRVAPSRDELLLAPITPETFEAQVAHAARYYRPLPLDAALDGLLAGTLPPRAVAITFDDGYRDNHRYAYPILRKYGVPAAIFLATDFIGTGRLAPHDEIAWLIHRIPASCVRNRGGVRGIDLPLDSASARRAVLERLASRLRSSGAEETAALLSILREAARVSSTDPPPPAMLDWQEVRAMADGGIVFGSHGRSHIACAKLGPAALHSELAESKAIIERELGSRVRLYAYPFGKPPDIGPEAPAAVREAGYDYAMTTVDGLAGPHTDPFLVPRGGPAWEHDPAAFAVRLAQHRLAAVM